tara:strand:+ start:60 stop:707 length:648 start_codon:yes stop_codon:yes gene_type:complete
MSSVIKVGKVQSSTGQDAIEIANDGHIQNALTLDGGIANAGTITAGTLGSSVVFPAGHLIQTASSSFNGFQTINFSASTTDITSLSCSMTITSGNKVWISANVMVGFGQDDYGVLYITDGTNIIYQNTTGTGNQRNATAGLAPHSTGSSGIYLPSNNPVSYLWTPSTTSITVKIAGRCTYSDSNSNIYINRGEASDNNTYVVLGTSTLTIFEVQA